MFLSSIERFRTLTHRFSGCAARDGGVKVFLSRRSVVYGRAVRTLCMFFVVFHALANCMRADVRKFIFFAVQ